MTRKLEIIDTMTVRDGYKDLTIIIAKSWGWESPDEGSALESAELFLAKLNVESNLREKRALIKAGLERYFGISQQALIDKALLDFDDSCKISFTWSEVEK